MNNIKIYKFLLPVSILIFVVVSVLLILSFADVITYHGGIAKIYFWLASIGFVSFVIGLVNLRISQKQSVINVGQEKVSQKPQRTLAKVAMILISPFIILAVLGGLIAIALSVSF